MTTTMNPMAGLRERLRATGIGVKFLYENILPDWWDDEIAAFPAGLAQVHGYLYTRAGIDLDTRKDSAAPLRFPKKAVKFKKAKSVGKGELSVSKALAQSAAAVIARGTRQRFTGLGPTIGGIRDTIICAGERAVNLDTLLDYCWSVGIPVIHIDKFPAKAKKMEGMTTLVDGRPVIVLSKSLKRPSWQAFILAHELGHIYHGHLADVDVLIDYKLQEGEDDEEERAANLFAVELLTGIPNITFSSPYLLKADELARAAVQSGEKLNVEPGVIVLNYGKTKGTWSLANAALALVGESESALDTIHRKMLAQLDVENIGEENYDWILSLTGASNHE
jgi:hypothetical protein